MPLKRGTSEKVFEHNLKQLMKKDDFSRDQALAIALELKEESKKKQSKGCTWVKPHYRYKNGKRERVEGHWRCD